MPGTTPNQGYPPLKEGFTRKDQMKAMYEYEKEPISIVNKIMGIAIAVCIAIYIVIRVLG